MISKLLLSLPVIFLVACTGPTTQDKIEEVIRHYEDSVSSISLRWDDYQFSNVSRDSVIIYQIEDFVDSLKLIEKDSIALVEIRNEIEAEMRLTSVSRAMNDHYAASFHMEKAESLMKDDSLLSASIDSRRQKFNLKNAPYVVQWYYKVEVTDRANGNVYSTYLLDTVSLTIRYTKTLLDEPYSPIE